MYPRNMTDGELAATERRYRSEGRNGYYAPLQGVWHEQANRKFAASRRVEAEMAANPIILGGRVVL